MDNRPASCTLLCSVCPLPPPATTISQQRGQQGDTSKVTENCCWVPGQYLGASSWVTGGQRGGYGFKLDLSTLIAASWALPAPGCSPDTTQSWGYLQIQDAFKVSYSFPEQNSTHKNVPVAWLHTSFCHMQRRRISQEKVVKVCDNMLRNPNISSLKNNSNCVRNFSFWVFAWCSLM